MRPNRSFQHLKSPEGVLKLIHVIFGGISIALVFLSYIPVFKLKYFLGSVAACLVISSTSLIARAVWNDIYKENKAWKIFSLVFHILGGMALVIAGIDLDGWSEYDKSCAQNCPNIYAVGVSKILTFINGTLYGIAAYLEVREDEVVDEYSEVLPLILVQDTSKCQENECRNSVLGINSMSMSYTIR